MKKSKISCNLKSEFSRKCLEEPTNHISINMGWAFYPSCLADGKYADELFTSK